MGKSAGRPLHSEKVAYWYFRLNGFLQMANFIVHPGTRGSARTDADLVGVRFRHRAEFVFDHDAPILDDPQLKLRPDSDEVVIVEVKTNQPCTLNGPWTMPDRENVHRVLAAIGCLSLSEVASAAQHIYEQGAFQRESLRIRLVAIGRDRSDDLTTKFPKVLQLTWDELVPFIWERLRTYRNQKRQVDQWDSTGKTLVKKAGSLNRDDFLREIKQRAGISG